MNQNSMPRLDQIERFLRVATQLKFLFGFSNISIIVLVIIGVVLFFGYFSIRNAFDPGSALHEADTVYANDQTKGIEMYKKLLAKRENKNPHQPWLTTDRDRLYRQIISFEVRYGSRDAARDYVRMAWNENFKLLSFEDADCRELWKEETAGVEGQILEANEQ